MTTDIARISDQLTSCREAIAYHQSKGSDHSHLDSHVKDLEERLEEALRLEKAANNPEVGMGASYRLWTDVEPCTIIEVRRNGKELVLQVDKATLLNGANSGEEDALQFSPGGFAGHMSGTQRYSFERDPNGRTIRVSRRVTRSRSTSWRTWSASSATA